MSEQTINIEALAEKYPSKKQRKENKPETLKAEEVKVETPKVEEKPETLKAEEVKVETPKVEEKPVEVPKTEDEKIKNLQVINFFKQPKEAIELLCSVFGISKEILENPIIKALFPISETLQTKDNRLLKDLEVAFKDLDAIVKGISMRFKNVNDSEDRQLLLNGLHDSYETFSVRLKGITKAYHDGTL